MPNKTTVYVVFGATGQYSDYVSWEVAAYHDEDQARHHAARANYYAAKLPEDALGHYPNPWDEHMDADGSVHYGVKDIPLYHDVASFRLTVSGSE